jgi:superfamily I DNA/RNA helicase
MRLGPIPVAPISTPRTADQAARISRPPARLARSARIRHLRPAPAWRPWTIAATGRKPARAGAANIEKFLAQAREASRRKSLDEFVDELARVRASNPREPDAPVDDVANAVKVMTVHSAKGLEFPGGVRGGAAQRRGIEPAGGGLLAAFGLGARWRNPAKREREDKDDLFQHALREEWKQREQQESDRLLYVAMTRAEEHLVLSFSARKHGPRTWPIGCNSPRRTGRPDVTRVAPDGKPWNLRVVVAAQRRNC